jgi:serine/threonine protein kinase
MPLYNKRRFDREVRALKQTNHFQDGYIIRLLTTFEIPTRGYYLLFPRAFGDLDFFWRTGQSLERLGNTARWMAGQCHHLTVALSMIHGIGRESEHRNHPDSGTTLRSRHGDVRAPNILWFLDGGPSDLEHSRLVLADFDHAQIYDENALEEKLAPNSGSCPSYIPPEDERLLTSAADIWSLGCTYLEFVTWFLLGWDAVQTSFPEARYEIDKSGILCDTFFQDTRNPVALKDGVRQWIWDLGRNESCSAYVEDFLVIVSDCMLEIDPGKRIAATELSGRLKGLYDRCLGDEGYCSARVPPAATT